MGQGVIIVKKIFQGEEWDNTYPFSVAGGGALTDGDLTAIGMDRDFTDAGTTPGNIGYGDGLGALPLAYSILGFERLIHATAVQFLSVYVTDKLDNSSILDLGANNFASKPVSFAGLKNIAEPAPGNTALLVNRVPARFGRRAGRLTYRAALSKDQVAFLGRNLLDWKSNSDKVNVQNDFATAVQSSGLVAFFQGGNGLGETGIGRYRAGVQIPPNDVGDLFEVVQIEGFRVQRPVSRQVRAGRKRPA